MASGRSKLWRMRNWDAEGSYGTLHCMVNSIRMVQSAAHSRRTAARTNRYEQLTSRSGCWFCLGSANVEKHLIVSIADDVYMALAKGLAPPPKPPRPPACPLVPALSALLPPSVHLHGTTRRHRDTAWRTSARRSLRQAGRSAPPSNRCCAFASASSLHSRRFAPCAIVAPSRRWAERLARDLDADRAHAMRPCAAAAGRHRRAVESALSAARTHAAASVCLFVCLFVCLC